MTDLPIVKRYIRMAVDGWQQGWHERNGGNLTYRLTPEEVAQMRPYFDDEPREWVHMGVKGENLAGEYFLSTGSGKYFRNVTLDPADSICVVEINEAGDSYRSVWGLVNGGRPTSELPCHIMNQRRVPRDLSCASGQHHCHDLCAPAYGPRFQPRPVEERHRVPRGVSRRRGRGGLDGSRRCGDCAGNL